MPFVTTKTKDFIVFAHVIDVGSLSLHYLSVLPYNDPGEDSAPRRAFTHGYNTDYKITILPTSQ